jgi:hypothetical protein
MPLNTVAFVNIHAGPSLGNDPVLFLMEFHSKWVIIWQDHVSCLEGCGCDWLDLFIETSRDQVRQERVRRLTEHPGRMASLTATVSLLPHCLLRFFVSRFHRSRTAATCH